MFVGLLFWFQFYCGFSASAMIDQWYLIFFNLLFSSLPQLVTGVLDKDVTADVLLAEPQLYRSGQNMEVSPGPRRPFRGHPGQTEQGRYRMRSLRCGIPNAVIYKTDSLVLKTNFCYQRRNMAWRGKLGA